MFLMSSALIVTGPAGSGKSHWIQAYAKEKRKQLLACPCRKDRTLREGRQKLHIWGRRREQTVLWLEGADDLTPEAQAFLRRILETHSVDVQFVLECRDPGKLQEPIRSRCTIHRLTMPTREQLTEYITRAYTAIDVESIFTYLQPDEYSYRRIQQALFLQMQYPDIWKLVVQKRLEERVAAKDARAELIPTYQSLAMNPEVILEFLLDSKPSLLGDYGECLELSGSLWAFLGSTLP
jgi:ATPase family associated with various cellular activities (AAA)